MHFIRKAGALILATALAAAPAAHAEQAADKPSSQIVIGGGTLTAAEQKDLATVNGAMAAVQARGYAGLSPWLPKLREALDKAPIVYPAVEAQEDRIIVRANDTADALAWAVAVMAARVKAEDEPQVNVVTQANVYPLIAMILGSAAVEEGDYRGAVERLDQGLALQPNDWALVTEKAAALAGLRRWDDALALVDATLASGDILVSLHAASLHRKRGYVLVELGRLDEAEAAYRESLKTAPDDRTAQAELQYIADRRAGHTPAEPDGPILVAPAAKQSP